MEFPVSPESAPYLVSSTRTVLWVERAFNDRVRAAARRVETGALMLEIIRAVQKRGREEKWGNAFPFTAQGVKDAISYLEYFGLTDVEILLNPANDLWDQDQEPARTRLPWLPVGMGVVVPMDRSYLGFQARTPTNRLLSLVHNPSRGMSILGE